MSRLRSLTDAMLSLPAARWTRGKWQRRLFRARPGLCHGVYPDFAAAAQAAPAGAKLGYDNPEMSGLYREPFPPDLRWVVQDVPAVIGAGIALAQERSASALSFTRSIADGDGSDVLIAAGSLQYIERPLADDLIAMRSPPTHLFLHKLPLTDGPSFVTLQNTVHAFSPYRVFNRAEFVQSFTALGYSVVDAWDDHERKLMLPASPERSIETYSGLYLRRRGTSGVSHG